MKEITAIAMLGRMELAVQTLRTRAMEELGVDDEREDSNSAKALQMTHPWLFGDGSILIMLSHLNERIRKGSPLEAQQFYNLMVIVDRTPLLSAWNEVNKEGWPEPSMKIFAQWEPLKPIEESENDVFDPGKMIKKLHDWKKSQGIGDGE